MEKKTQIQVNEILPPAENKTVLDAVTEIRNASTDASTAVLRLAKTLQKWNARKEWNEIEAKLDKEQIISESVRKKLMRIGSNTVLMNEENWDKLPIGYNQLYPLTQIEDDRLVKLIQSDKVHNGLTVEESNQLKNNNRAKKEPQQRKTKVIHYTIKIKVSSDVKNIKSSVKSYFSEFKKHISEVDENAVVELNG